MRKCGLPSFKTIERIRREIQNVQHHCQASESVEAGRREAEKIYRNRGIENE